MIRLMSRLPLNFRMLLNGIFWMPAMESGNVSTSKPQAMVLVTTNGSFQNHTPAAASAVTMGTRDQLCCRL